jgi:ferredoxin
MKVSIDATVCQGHARCMMLCPEVFDADEMGYAVLLTEEVPDGLEQAVTSAVLNCPEQAIATET